MGATADNCPPALVVMRRLRRTHKTRAALRQVGTCAYCACALPEAFEVDHLICGTPRDDRPANLAACCGTCHNHKSLCEREARESELQRMIDAARRRKEECRARLRRLDTAQQRRESFAQLPAWLQGRPDAKRAWLYVCAGARAVRAPPSLWRQFSYLSGAPACRDPHALPG